ncbi:glycoside hydrolase family 3 C-terminal domain-containing protein [Streptomyces sp. 110]|uniref:Glycoside hydrolase family 3 C-terminal domain-containing protein n=1 Tax=Streptomyces endocoffeicus TaxID=2898945 RepID=A0ABS1Q6U2_9ACTN|nr:glycoside hydrolase family 3 N-terminal domain-containing protein [Streptomyces endocoffeicus]MBL1119666.1 glycoside hydrolase family 3 C-terminal domain-containing protein [Streptomyces endocoffeicus]
MPKAERVQSAAASPADGTSGVDRLLAEMSLREKVGQLNQRLYGWQAVERTPRGGFRLTSLARAELDRWGGLGALYGLFRADAWSGRSWADGIRPEERAEVAAHVQDEVAQAGRHGIGVLLTEEAPHGHQALGGTLLPTNLSVACGWDPVLLREAAAAVAAELAASGVHLALVSCLDLLRDPRWGRAEECFGEDPLLAAELTAAVVSGMQGGGRSIGKGGVAVVVKHLAAQGEAVGGRNGQSAVIGFRDLHELHLPAVRAAVDAGALGFMAAYNDIDGVPCCANRDLLTGYLRGVCGFDGIVMSDGLAVDRLAAATGDKTTAAVAALGAGVDLSLWDESFSLLESAATDPRVVQLIDTACRRILVLKQRMGLLSTSGQAAAGETTGTGGDTLSTARERLAQAARTTDRLSARLARQSLVLLHNRQGLLPLSPETLTRIVLIGPNARDATAMLGDYVPPLPDGAATGVDLALRKVLPNTEVVCPSGIPSALDLHGADAVILLLGGTSHRPYGEQFAANGAIAGAATVATAGEGVDLADVSLPGGQDNLVAAVRERARCPVIAVVVAGRPHVLTTVRDNTDAILWAGYPGPHGGAAITEALLGLSEPTGRLPFTAPSHAGAVPVRYNDRHPAGDVYRDAPEPVLFPFGFGLRYRPVRFENCTAEVDRSTVRVSVEAVSETDGDDTEVIVPLFGHLTGGSVLPRQRELLAFRRVTVPGGGRTTVAWDLPAERCFAEGATGRARTDLYVADLRHTIRPYGTRPSAAPAATPLSDT